MIDPGRSDLPHPILQQDIIEERIHRSSIRLRQVSLPNKLIERVMDERALDGVTSIKGAGHPIPGIALADGEYPIAGQMDELSVDSLFERGDYGRHHDV